MQVNAVFSLYEREKRQVEWIYKQARTGQVWLKGFPFSQPGFYMRSDISFYAFFFFFRSCFFLIYCKDRTGNEDFTYEGGFKQRMD